LPTDKAELLSAERRSKYDRGYVDAVVVSCGGGGDSGGFDAAAAMQHRRRRSNCFSGWPKTVRRNVSAATAAFLGNAVFGIH